MLTEYDSQHAHRDPREHHQQQQQQQQLPPQQPRLSSLERGRSIKLMRNGDPFFPGRAFVINQRKYPMLDVFLDDASQALHANFGAVRCIYTPKNGTRLHDISEFEDHRTYVAGGGERFKRLQYYEIAEGRRVHGKDRTPPRLPPVRRFDIEGRALKLSRSENVIIYVYRNGDPLTLPAKILLVKSTLQNWESVLDEVTKKVSLTSSAVLKLYSMNGELITSAQQLEYNGSYAAAGKERFKRIEYPDPKSISPNSSPKMSRKSDHQIILPVRLKRVDDHVPSNRQQPMLHRYSKSDGTNTHTANSHGSNEHGGHRRPVREENDFFNSRPQALRRGPAQETDLDRDDGGIYKGRFQHRERVREIEDTRETKVDLPVDYREVETVEDEDLHGNNERKPRRNYPPPGPIKPAQAVANSRRRSPPARPMKAPPKGYPNGEHDENHHENDDGDDDVNDHHAENNRFAMNNGSHQRSNNTQPKARSNGYDDEYHRRTPPAPPRVDDQIYDEDDGDHDERPTSRSHHRGQFTPPSAQDNPRNKDHAATVIQSHVRGYLTRKQTHHEKPQHDHVDHSPNHHDEPDQTKRLTDDRHEHTHTNHVTNHSPRDTHQHEHGEQHQRQPTPPPHASSQRYHDGDDDDDNV